MCYLFVFSQYANLKYLNKKSLKVKIFLAEATNCSIYWRNSKWIEKF